MKSCGHWWPSCGLRRHANNRRCLMNPIFCRLAKIDFRGSGTRYAHRLDYYLQRKGQMCPKNFGTYNTLVWVTCRLTSVDGVWFYPMANKVPLNTLSISCRSASVLMRHYMYTSLCRSYKLLSCNCGFYICQFMNVYIQFIFSFSKLSHFLLL